ncbi:MAG: YheC/YheD family protein [Firmicutes bacterium]|nr:YheC/YheD family protein [Bacillota bacterium]
MKRRPPALNVVVDARLPPAAGLIDPAGLPLPPEALGGTVRLALGGLCRRVRLEGGAPRRELRLDPATASALGLPLWPAPPRLSLRVRATPGGLRLGPVIGLFLGDGSAEDPESLLPWQAFCLAQAPVAGFIYAFDFAQEDAAAWPEGRAGPVPPGRGGGKARGERLVRGRLWDGRAFRAPAALPRPDAVWKRGEAVAELQPVLHRLCRGRLFNERLRWSKAEVQAVLAGRPHVPEGFAARLADETLAADAIAVGRFLERGAAYLKPVYGSQGNGVARLSREGAGCRLQLDGTATVAPLEAVLRRYRDRAPSPAGYLVQRAIDQAAPGTPVDLRVMVQRGRDGRLRCTGMWARLAEAGSVVSNRSAGGRLVEPHAMLRALGFADGAGRLAAVARGTVLLARRLEAAFGRIGEAGFDVMFDRAGEWWVLEVNPRPGLMIFAAADPAAFRRMVRAPLEYAAALSGF